jgi:hypothetical protein
MLANKISSFIDIYRIKDQPKNQTPRRHVCLKMQQTNSTNAIDAAYLVDEHVALERLVTEADLTPQDRVAIMNRGQTLCVASAPRLTRRWKFSCGIRAVHRRYADVSGRKRCCACRTPAVIDALIEERDRTVPIGELVG